MITKIHSILYYASSAIVVGISPAHAQSSLDAAAPQQAEAGQVGEIIVTAQKREQSINSVGMSITATSGEQLMQSGVASPEDLVKVVPGLVYTPSPLQTPVYSVRGIGFYEKTLGAAPTVTVYVDQVPLVSPLMTLGASLDIERVEVLKGPQGTLFGQNSTGGAINYIAAKPTSSLEAGGSATVERFGRTDLTGYVSGPISDTLLARVAARTTQGGEWQYSQTRPGDKLGDERKLFGRVLLDWTPSDRLAVSLNLNGYRDRSDSQAFQMTTRRIFQPAWASPTLLNAPFAPDKARAADWSEDNPMRFNNRFWQASGRIDYDLIDNVNLTSMTTYSDLKTDIWNDQDGTAAHNVDNHQTGYFESFNQELRLSGATGRLTWIIGANYQRDRAFDNNVVFIDENTLNHPVQAIPGFENVPPIEQAVGRTRQKIKTKAVFANAEYQMTDALNIQAGIRYSDSRRRGNACSADNLSTNATGQNFEALQQLFMALGAKASPFVPVGPGQCYILDSTLSPDLDGVDVALQEDNISWRFGLNYKMLGGTLVYANVSRGYKDGAIPQINASSTSAFVPAVQERVDAYEVGVKTPLSPRLHVNAAGFYYDYRNKQIRGSVVDPIFGTLETLVNVPKSRIWGLESELTAEPIDGLAVKGGITYIKAKITETFQGINREGFADNYDGSPLPYSPKITANADAQYEWQLASGLKPFVGGSIVYHSRDNATFRSETFPATAFDIKAYTTLDLRAGVSAEDDSWRVMVFGRNVTNTFYWTGVTQASDTFVRSAAKPAVYGLTLSVRTR